MNNEMVRPNLLYFDVEYANSKNKSICQMGLMIEDVLSKDPTYPELNLYVNPADEFDPKCVSVHNITEERVANEKTFDVLWNDVEKYFINSVVVGHNVRGSDLDALCKNLIRYNIALPEFYYIDTYEIAREYISATDISDYRLSTLCEYFDLYIDSEHDAFDDACACSDLLNELKDRFGFDLQAFVHHYEYEKDYTFSPFVINVAIIRECNFLLGMVKGFLTDGLITNEEKAALQKWRNEHESISSVKYGATIIDFIDTILSDGILTNEEVKGLENLLIKITQDFSASVETRATQELQGIVEGIVADNEINESELLFLQKWIYENEYLIGHYPYDKIKVAIEKVIEDCIITEDEKNYLSNLFYELFNPVSDAVQNLIIFEGKEFCLSGDFAHGSKKDVENYIESNGGTINQSVRKKTNYVVVGQNGSAAYSNGTYGTKVKKAMEMNIAVITEKQLYNEI